MTLYLKTNLWKNSLITTVGGAVRCSGKSKGSTKYVFTKLIKSSVVNNIIRWECVVYTFCSQHFVYYYFYLIFLSYLIIQLRRSKKLKNFKQNVEKKMYSKISQHWKQFRWTLWFSRFTGKYVFKRYNSLVRNYCC